MRAERLGKSGRRKAEPRAATATAIVEGKEKPTVSRLRAIKTS
jgi:hypothetical protein